MVQQPAVQQVAFQQPPQQAWQAQGAGAVAAAAPKSGLNVKVIVIAAVVALAVVIGVFLFASGGASGIGGGAGNGKIATVSTHPAVRDGNTEIAALERPSLIGVLPAYADEVATPSVPQFTIESNLSNVTNIKNYYLDDNLKSLIQQNGFAVNAGTSYYEFFEIYERNRYAQLPNFVTTDSMMHTYHLYFQYLQKNTERNYLSAQLLNVSRAMLEETSNQLTELAGTEWESAAKRSVAYFAVGVKLLDPSAQVPAAVADMVNTELANIEAHQGFVQSPIQNNLEDYTQYIVRGYYEGDENLERYFRAMMWYGRTNFKQSDEDLDRTAMLITLAMHNGQALSGWESIYTITSFFAGASDDCGYYEYYPLIAAVYGEETTASSLAGRTSEWQRYHDLTAKMPAPQINSIVVEDRGTDVDHQEEEKGYRFMGQRFTLDEMIFTNLCYNKTGENAQGGKRMLPDALDVPAALGSDTALSILEQRGATGYKDFSENMSELRTSIAENDALWTGSLYAQWLYTLNPLLAEKGEGYPQFMQSDAWNRKDLQTYLGSYTELKHDTVLYSKQMMTEMGGGVEPKDDRGYVEPEPELYRRLANLTKATSDGLSNYGMLSADDAANLERLMTLSNQLADISEKELANQSLSDADYELIRTYGGSLEHFWEEVYKNETTKSYLATKEFPAAIVVDVATNGDTGEVLELGTGWVSTVYVVVPGPDGQPRLASGSTYSFYQFTEPGSNRLTDTKWRQMNGIELNDAGKYDASGRLPLQDWTDDFTYVPQSGY